MNEVKLFEGNRITFQVEDGTIMINATEMSKSFGKRPVDWLHNDATCRFIDELIKVRKVTLADLVIIRKGGNNAGTWMHEDVALEFARWLNPAFSIWCNDRIKELIKVGFTATPQKLEELVENPDLVIKLAWQLKTERKKTQLLDSIIEDHMKTINRLSPLAELAERVSIAEGTYSLSETVKILQLPFGRNEFIDKLRIDGIFFKNKRSEPKEAYIKTGYFVVKTKPIEREHHPNFNIIQVYVTPLGLKWLAKRYNSTVKIKVLKVITE